MDQQAETTPAAATPPIGEAPVPSGGSAPPPVRHPLAVPHVRSFWLGSTISLLGDQFYLVALPWLVLQLTGSGLALGTVLMTTDPALMGRVMSVLLFSGIGMIPISYAIAGVLAQWNLPALFLIAGTVLVGFAAVGLSRRQVRAID
jgi:hypothetical protein